MTDRYAIVRFYLEGSRRRVIHRDLTLEEAQAHCNDPETSSSTCRKAANRARTRARGPWFDGYRKQ